MRAYGNATYFHVINVFLWQKNTLPEIKQISNETVIMELHDEAWCRPATSIIFMLLLFVANIVDCSSFITDINASLVGFAYPSEMLIPDWKELAERRHFFHIPKTVAAERFYKPPDPAKDPPKSLEEVVAAYDSKRDIDVLFIGYMHPRIYPFRWKVCYCCVSYN